MCAEAMAPSRTILTAVVANMAGSARHNVVHFTHSFHPWCQASAHYPATHMVQLERIRPNAQQLPRHHGVYVCNRQVQRRVARLRQRRFPGL
jgi:hypothetical protein